MKEWASFDTISKGKGIWLIDSKGNKIIDDKTTKRIGDLRFYLGSSEWWDNNASLQENDTSGFNNIFKVKFAQNFVILRHFTLALENPNCHSTLIVFRG
mgnify:CR=1 FL=1